MYKLLGILTVAVFGVNVVQSTSSVTGQPSVTAQPVVVEAKSQPSAPPSHKRSKLSPEQLNQLKEEKFNKRRDAKVAQLAKYQNKVKTLKDKVSKENQDQFDAHLNCANLWIEDLKEYKSPETNLRRAVSFAAKEIASARKLAALKPTSSKQQAIPPYPDKDIEKLKDTFGKVKADLTKMTGDNQVAFQTMINCVETYLKVLEAAKGKPVNVHECLVQAMEYVNTMEVFVDTREGNRH